MEKKEIFPTLCPVSDKSEPIIAKSKDSTIIDSGPFNTRGRKLTSLIVRHYSIVSMTTGPGEDEGKHI